MAFPQCDSLQSILLTPPSDVETVVSCRLVAGRAIAIHADVHCEQVYYGDTLATNENTSNSLSLYIQGTHFCFEYLDPEQAFNAYSQFPNLASLETVAQELIHP